MKIIIHPPRLVIIKHQAYSKITVHIIKHQFVPLLSFRLFRLFCATRFPLFHCFGTTSSWKIYNLLVLIIHKYSWKQAHYVSCFSFHRCIHFQVALWYFILGDFFLFIQFHFSSVFCPFQRQSFSNVNPFSDWGWTEVRFEFSRGIQRIVWTMSSSAVCVTIIRRVFFRVFWIQTNCDN